MIRAIELGAKYRGKTRPNPPVGAVIVSSGRIIAEGAHKVCGAAHAEAMAIKKAGSKAKGATIYVTLEPCSKAGRVGPCTEAIIKAGIKRVVYACHDPNPVMKSRAKRILSNAGIKCECWQSSKDSQKREVASIAYRVLLKGFAKHVTTSLPYVTVKVAMSLDGRICDINGASRWISSKDTRAMTGKWREVVDVVLVGAGTLRADNPSLLCHTKKNDSLWRAVVSSSGKLPKSAQVFTDEAKDRTLVYRDAVEAITDLGRRGFMHVLCEGGLKLASSLAEASLVDEWYTILAPIVIGSRPISNAVKFMPDTLIESSGDVVFSCLGDTK
ncbi:MAG: bifunctional diaminohydroxyphosphoribosylaminopyrimidine deaminase/5-amino-6-(5-phosphoribosylamino)uracil reductase RibD [Kiritimatiellae bacterium]|nr:bifunctional diaminohydroxyphosphoribosylaminopyrimidine deaminase/5-amino-6-(5-phosphoribosylamino)uracil reductase RibD [Kiritimatiellia bacterium]